MKKEPITTTLWDPVDNLNTEEDIMNYLEAAFAAVLGDIARARGMAAIAEKTGLGRTSLYKALSPDGPPEFATVMKVVKALGLKLRAMPVKN